MINIKEAFPEYEKPSVAIDTVLIRTSDIVEPTKKQTGYKQMQVLLISKKDENSNRQWHLPGTILRLGETPKDAIDRIINEKTKANEVYYEQLYTVADNPERDERGHIISIVYIGLVNSKTEVSLPDDSEYEARWFWVDKADADGIRRLSGDVDIKDIDLLYDHNHILSDTIDRLKGKLMYTNIGFRLMDKTFTIKELENSFEAINERIIPGFRRYIANKIEGTGIMSSGNYYRPAELFKERR